MANNILKKIGIGIEDVSKWVATAVKDVVSLTTKVEKVLNASKPLEQPFITGLATVVGDVEALLADADGAVTASGMNFAADSKTFQDFMKLIDDFKNLAPIVNEAIQILEGKSPAAPAAAK